LSDFLLGISALVGAFAVIAGGIRWLADKLNKNTTIIKSLLPYLKIGDYKYHLIKSQHEISQFIRDAPLEILQISSIMYFVHFNSIDMNENKVEYKSYCKPKLGFKWILESERDNNNTLSQKIKRAKSYLFNTQYHEDYYFKPVNTENNIDGIHKLECEYSLDPIRFLPFYKYISISVRVINSNKSHTAWCNCKIDIEDDAIKSMFEKIPELKTEKEQEDWLKKWKKDFDAKNEEKFDLGGKC
jgi:hypothetical protein